MATPRELTEALQHLGLPIVITKQEPGLRVDKFYIQPQPIAIGKRPTRVGEFKRLREDIAITLKVPGVEVYSENGELILEVARADVPKIHVSQFATQRPSGHLPIIVGVAGSGKPVCIDLADLPHLLIAGTTGSGKSILMHEILYCLLKWQSPGDMLLATIDPKWVELTRYEGTKHLVGAASAREDAIDLLKRVDAEMRRRYQKLKASKLTSIAGTGIPRLVLVIDELADLILGDSEVEDAIVRIAQLGRAAGVHVIAATQRPSHDVVTGLIKANFPARISLAVPSGWDSKVILDQTGAEKLLGKGDALFRLPGKQGLIRMQVPNITPADSEEVVKQWSREKQVSALSEIQQEPCTEFIPSELTLEVIRVLRLTKTVPINEMRIGGIVWNNKTLRIVIKELITLGYTFKGINPLMVAGGH